MMSSTAIDYERVRHFAGKVMGDLAGVSASLLAIIGDRLVVLGAGRRWTGDQRGARRAGRGGRHRTCEAGFEAMDVQRQASESPGRLFESEHRGRRGSRDRT